MTTVYCDEITCDNNCDCECVLDFIHVDKNGKCVDNEQTEGDNND